MQIISTNGTKMELKIQNATDKDYAINEVSYEHPGYYWVQITNDNAPSLTLYRDTITLSLEIVEEFTCRLSCPIRSLRCYRWKQLEEYLELR